ncbi:MAG: hypothetical protein EBU90_31720 [Proteobacteria bacterium]|nr:hypothetical protein [Pseudomonadota bacterium]
MKTEIYSNGVLVSVIDNRTPDEARAYSLDLVRIATSKAIEEAGLDDKTQLNAIAGIYPPERCETIKSYISVCRNEYLRCKELIQTAQTNDEADAVQFFAQSVPEGL